MSKVRKWQSVAVASVLGAVFGATVLSVAPVYGAEGVVEAFWGKLFQNGTETTGAPAITYQGTTYFGLWYLQRALDQDGVTTSWDGTDLSLSHMPVQGLTTLTVATNSGNLRGPSISTSSVKVAGQTYVPLTTVQKLLQRAGAGVTVTEDVYGDAGSQKEQENSNIVITEVGH